MRVAHQYWKMVVLGFLMLMHGTIGNLARLFLTGVKLREFQLELTRRNARIMMNVLDLNLEVEGAENWRDGHNYLIVSNHLSYLDILLFASVKPVCFVSTVEVRQTPVLGQLTMAAGALFVERRTRGNIREEISMIETQLKNGFTLAFFPEGTSTNGASVLPFKRPFFAPAQEAQCSVLPVVVQPLEIDGKKVDTSNRDLVCYYGDMDFRPHLFALAGCKSIRMKLKILPEIPVTMGMSREEIGAKAQAAVTENFQPLR